MCTKRFWVKKSGSKTFVSQKEIFVQKTFLGQKKFGPKKMKTSKKLGPKGLVIIKTNVARTNVAWTNVTVKAGICSRYSKELTFKVSLKLSQ